MKNPYADLRKKIGRPLFIPFAVLGHPDKATSMKVIETLITNGADALELGMPFSDPTADGPVIQAADKQAIESGITTDGCLEIIREIRKKSAIPVGILTYFNIVFRYGIDAFYEECSKAGVTSVLVADLPLEHAEEAQAAAKKNNIAPVFIVSELTTKERLKSIVKLADGYLYLVSYLGVTGAAKGGAADPLKKLITLCRSETDLPLFVGFGISTKEHVAMVAGAGADGVIVGSRIVSEVPDLKKIAATCNELRRAIPGVQ